MYLSYYFFDLQIHLDLSLIQWDIVKKLEQSSKNSRIAGDDDQAIYKWNGADPETFINLEGERIILKQ